MNKQELFTRYEELKAVINEAEYEIEKLKPQIIELVPEGKEVEASRGVFSVQSRATWKFSKDHELMKESLKEKEEEEKAKGIAVATYKPVLFYKVAKED